MDKLCKICWLRPVNRYSIPAVCWEKCYGEYKRRKEENKAQMKTTIKTLIDERTSNTTRNVSELIKRRVYRRDNGVCVLCWNESNLESTPHHVLYGWEAIYTKERNYVNQLVTICQDCHYEIHHKGNRDKREQCKTYLKEYYKNRPYIH